MFFLKKKGFAVNLAMKIDIRKTFDTLEWSLLISVLQNFGFNQTFCNWIDKKVCIQQYYPSL
jgi:hypothetical protein